MKKKMFYDAGATIIHNARGLRNQPTQAERILWGYLKTKPNGYKFRRQHPAANYILDFYCHALKLAIEADGSIHNEKDIIASDIERQKNIEVQGIQFIRFTNKEIILNLETVIENIDLVIVEYSKKQNI